MPISQAYRRCRHGIYLVPRMERYQEVSEQVMDVLKGYAPSFRQISIDEATLDMSGTSRVYGEPIDAAQVLKDRVRAKTGLTISVGVAPSRYLAKLASEYDKPDGLWMVSHGQEEAFLDELKLQDLWGLGKKTLERLTELNITTVKQLRGIPEATLQTMIGNGAGSYLYRVVRGYEPGMYSEATKSKSVSAEVTFGEDTRDRLAIQRSLLDLSHHIMDRALGEQYRSRTVTLKVRFSDFSTTTVQKTLRHLITSGDEIYAVGIDLLDKRWNGSDAIRLIGIGLSGVDGKDAPEQNELFEDSFDRKKRVEEAVIRLKEKNPENRVVKASLLEGKFRHSNKNRDGDEKNDPSRQ